MRSFVFWVAITLILAGCRDQEDITPPFRGCLLKESLTYSNQQTWGTRYEYNQYGKPTVNTSFYKGNVEVTIGKNTYEYSQGGRLVMHRSYNLQNVLIGKESTLYDAQGRELETISYRVESPNASEISGKTTKEYDAAGHVVKSTYFDGPALQVTSFYLTEYDQNGRKVKEEEHTLPYNRISTTVYRYNAQGNLEHQDSNTVTEGKTESQVRIEYQYNSNSKLLEEKWFINSNPNPVYRKKYYYDGSGILTRIEEYQNNEYGIRSSLTELNAQELITKLTSYDSEGNIEYTYWYEYNAQRQRTSFKYINSGNPTSGFSYFYQYDGYGNLVEQTSSNSDGTVNERTTYSYECH